jgi:hypothetical protein
MVFRSHRPIFGQPSIGGHHGTAKTGALGGGQNRAEQHPIPIHPITASRNQDELLIAISESRKSRRNSVHYPVNAG